MSDLEDLGRRAAVALATLEERGRIRSRWLPGMLLQGDKEATGVRVIADGETFTPMPDLTDQIWYEHWDNGVYKGRLFDLSDPLTVQALLLLLREATGDEGAMTMRIAPSCWESAWRTGAGSWHIPCRGLTEVEALVYALETLAAEVTS